MSFVRNDHIRYCDSSGGSERENERRREKEREYMCVCVYERVCVRIGKRRIRARNVYGSRCCERSVRERRLEIRILVTSADAETIVINAGLYSSYLI